MLWVADTWLPYCRIMGVYGADEQGSWWAGGAEQVVYGGECCRSVMWCVALKLPRI